MNAGISLVRCHGRLKACFCHALAALLLFSGWMAASAMAGGFLTDPFLQLPGQDSVYVVWFTDFEGIAHHVELKEEFFAADSMLLSRMQEDVNSHWAGKASMEGQGPWTRKVWRHEARVTGLQPGERAAYRVCSRMADDREIRSDIYVLSPLPWAGQSLKILLSSDHQLKPRVGANLQKVLETIGKIDGVFMAGDLVNVPDRASEWFDDDRGLAFFPNFQGLAGEEKPGRRAGILQNAPIFPVIGNHEIMGQRLPGKDLDWQFYHPLPREMGADSFNWITYREIFSLPQEPAREEYYSIRFGDVALIALNLSRAWRFPDTEEGHLSKYEESDPSLDRREWSHGEFLFGDIAAGSPQHDWLLEVLAGEQFRTAPVKVVMLHHSIAGLGENAVPVYTPPHPEILTGEGGKIERVRYHYPPDDDLFRRDVLPHLIEAGVHLVYFGHSHLWNRLKVPGGPHLLESSNVGNGYGAYWPGVANRWTVPPEGFPDPENYPLTGDPHGLDPEWPTLAAPMKDSTGRALPFVCSNDLTVFTVLDTGRRCVSSYVFDATRPDGPVRKFDEFSLD